MAAKVETLRFATKVRPRVGIVKSMGTALRRWGGRGQLGAPSTSEMGRATGARC
ncbi:MAG: hypothetical protein H0V97_13150 [Actinobacteria bacterium]|nr:hypothetical protein [Actinomycetota bacterium]